MRAGLVNARTRPGPVHIGPRFSLRRVNGPPYQATVSSANLHAPELY